MSLGLLFKASCISFSQPFVAKPNALQSCSPRMPKPIMPRRSGLPLIGPDSGGGVALMLRVSSRNCFSRFASPARLAPANHTEPTRGMPPSAFSKSRRFHLLKLLSFAMVISLLRWFYFFSGKGFPAQMRRSWETDKLPAGPPFLSGSCL